MEKRKLEAEIVGEVDILTEAKLKRNKTKVQWEEVVTNRKELREKQLLDMYNQVIEGDDEKAKKARKKQAAKLKKAEYRKWSL